MRVWWTVRAARSAASRSRASPGGIRRVAPETRAIGLAQLARADAERHVAPRRGSPTEVTPGVDADGAWTYRLSAGRGHAGRRGQRASTRIGLRGRGHPSSQEMLVCASTSSHGRAHLGAPDHRLPHGHRSTTRFSHRQPDRSTRRPATCFWLSTAGLLVELRRPTASSVWQHSHDVGVRPADLPERSNRRAADRRRSGDRPRRSPRAGVGMAPASEIGSTRSTSDTGESRVELYAWRDRRRTASFSFPPLVTTVGERASRVLYAGLAGGHLVCRQRAAAASPIWRFQHGDRWRQHLSARALQGQRSSRSTGK